MSVVDEEEVLPTVLVDKHGNSEIQGMDHHHHIISSAALL